jgi:DNA-binding NtrC family response regulator
VAAEWPGNVRQLQNAIEAGLIRAARRGASQLEVEHQLPQSRGGDLSPNEEGLTFQEATRRFQVALLRTTLEASDGNVIEAARRLDLARSHVYNLIRVFGLARKRA